MIKRIISNAIWELKLIFFMQHWNIQGDVDFYAATTAKSLQSCLTLCDPIDGSPPGSPLPGILQARTLEWVAISFANAWKWKLKGKSLSRVWLLATPWTAAYQAPLSVGFSRQEYWSGVPLPSPLTSIVKCKVESTGCTDLCQATSQLMSTLLKCSVLVLNHCITN